MFKTLYRCARTAARHENGPAARSRLAYLEHLAAGGATLHCLRANAGVLYRAAVCMNLDDTSLVERTAVESAARDWAHRPYFNAMASGPEGTEKEFRYITCRWLRFARRLQEPARPPTPHQAALDAYCRYMTEERGLAQATVTTARSELPMFLKYTAGKTLKQMRLADVEIFLAHLGEQGWTRHGINSMAHIIRGFFKYGEAQRWTKPGIGAEIHGPRVYRREFLPLGPSWPDVQRLLASTETDHPYDIRDRAILLLIAVYLNGRKGGPVTLFWHRKHDALKGFWEFAIRRGYTDRSPVPVHRAKEPVPFVPYIYSRDELKRLLDGVTSYQKKWLKLEPVTLRAMLLLIYGAGLRTSEALHLACTDVDLSAMTLTIRESKFYKTRRIALNAQLCGVLSEYNDNRRQKEHARSDAAPFFTYKDGGAVARFVLEDAFLRLRTHVGVKRQNARYQPRLHDLRHTFAVHRLTAWYRTGADVQNLLPGLSTHLGHLCLKGTQRYLTMTPELLTEASLRFEGYAQEVIHG